MGSSVHANTVPARLQACSIDPVKALRKLAVVHLGVRCVQMATSSAKATALGTLRRFFKVLQVKCMCYPVAVSQSFFFLMKGSV